MELDMGREAAAILQEHLQGGALDETKELRALFPDRAVLATVLVRLRIRLSEVCSADLDDAATLERMTPGALIGYLRQHRNSAIAPLCVPAGPYRL